MMRQFELISYRTNPLQSIKGTKILRSQLLCANFLERDDLHAEQQFVTRIPLQTAHYASAHLHRPCIAAVQLPKLSESVI